MSITIGGFQTVLSTQFHSQCLDQLVMWSSGTFQWCHALGLSPQDNIIKKSHPQLAMVRIKLDPHSQNASTVVPTDDQRKNRFVIHKTDRTNVLLL